ncbi:MAG: mycothiol system anti-sigma-R factor [Bifidobacteriaceae bacterium]|jgi:mycothiol system anti-sigma-R factor|nr:mycothiol system anti-sigma-R factor [Bifidobacteriaceae bacterium]
MTNSWTRFECEDALPRLYHFIDEELSYHELEAMRDHLDGCDNCSYEAEVRVKLKSVIREACLEAAPTHLRDKVSARIAEMRASMAEPV